MIWHSNPRTDHGTSNPRFRDMVTSTVILRLGSEARNADAGDSGEHGPMAHACKSDEHVGVSNISQSSDDGFSFIFSET